MQKERMARHTKQSEKLLRQMLDAIGIIVPESAIADLVEIIRMAGEQRGELEAYDHYMASHNLTATEREAKLSQQCHILAMQIERLIRVNRYLWALWPANPSHTDSRDIKAAVKTFSKLPQYPGE